MMPLTSWALLAAFLGVLATTVKPLGTYLAEIMGGTSRVVLAGGQVERTLLRLCGVKSAEEMSWKQYAASVLIFSLVGVLLVYGLQRLQLWLPFNPQHLANVSADSAFNTATSFVTNTNWQGYGGEATMSYLTQMLALTVQNFVSAATGIAVVFALIRGFASRGSVTTSSATIGNFWVDIYRISAYVLLPLAFVFALFLVSQGVIQNTAAYVNVTTLEIPTATAAGVDATVQTIAMGPVASQEAIKMLGTNGGGFFNANSAHPFENPSALTNFFQMLSIFLIPAALCYAFGRAVGDTRQGWAVLGAMTIIFVGMTLVVMAAEQHGNPQISALGVDQIASATQSGGNMEGKETRFGVAASALFAAITTAASCGAVNAMHDSFTPLGGLIPMLNIQLGEVVFGGVGSGLYGMLIFAIITVFVAGLMIGRTPEYLGKKIEAFEMKMVSLVILITPLLILVGTAIAVSTEAGRAGISNPGAHGFSQVLYAVTSAANNNGSAFAGLSANTPFYNTLLGVVMWLGRFGIIVPVLAIAGSLAAKTRSTPNAGSMPTHGLLFIFLLVGMVLIVGALTYVPALALGPIVEHLQLFSSK
jgi:potassium-transporting ATPase potassium-binding subunit